MTALIFFVLLGGLAVAGAGAHAWLVRLDWRRAASDGQRAREAAWRRALPGMPVGSGLRELTAEERAGLHAELHALEAAGGAR